MEEGLLSSVVAAFFFFLIMAFLAPASSELVATWALGYICTSTREHDQALEVDCLIH